MDPNDKPILSDTCSDNTSDIDLELSEDDSSGILQILKNLHVCIDISQLSLFMKYPIEFSLNRMTYEPTDAISTILASISRKISGDGVPLHGTHYKSSKELTEGVYFYVVTPNSNKYEYNEHKKEEIRPTLSGYIHLVR